MSRSALKSWQSSCLCLPRPRLQAGTNMLGSGVHRESLTWSLTFRTESYHTEGLRRDLPEHKRDHRTLNSIHPAETQLHRNNKLRASFCGRTALFTVQVGSTTHITSVAFLQVIAPVAKKTGGDNLCS